MSLGGFLPTKCRIVSHWLNKTMHGIFFLMACLNYQNNFLAFLTLIVYTYRQTKQKHCIHRRLTVHGFVKMFYPIYWNASLHVVPALQRLFFIESDKFLIYSTSTWWYFIFLHKSIHLFDINFNSFCLINMEMHPWVLLQIRRYSQYGIHPESLEIHVMLNDLIQ